MNEFTNKKEWNLTKIVLPQHTDHAGVMWHGSYFNFLEEGRIDALNQVGIKYSRFSKEGYEIPVISAQIKYKILGDLDGSNKLFNNVILKTNNSNPFHSNSIIEVINIMISKGQLLKAQETLQKYKNVINKINRNFS